SGRADVADFGYDALRAGIVISGPGAIADARIEGVLPAAAALLFLESLMMQPIRKITFLLEEFTTPSPAQQLLDRFLIGYPRDGAFHLPERATVSAHLMLPNNESDFDKRRDDFDLVIAPNAAQAVEGADAVVVASRKPGAVANDRFLQIALEGA